MFLLWGQTKERTPSELGTRPLPAWSPHVYPWLVESMPLSMTWMGSSEMTSNMAPGGWMCLNFIKK